MSAITFYALFILRDGELDFGFHHTDAERSAAINGVKEAIAAGLDLPPETFPTIIQLEEYYEQRTGRQLEILTQDVILTPTHPVLVQVIALMDCARNDLKDADVPRNLALSCLKKAMDLLRG